MVAKSAVVGKRNSRPGQISSRSGRAGRESARMHDERREGAVRLPAERHGGPTRLSRRRALGSWEEPRLSAYRAETPRRARDWTRRTSSSLSYGFTRKSHSTLMS
jgi:hypothetical protein